MDSSLYVRINAIEFAKLDAGVAALVAGRVKAAVEPDPVWPYIRYGDDTWGPWRATCMDGMQGSMTWHCFAMGASDDACRLVAAALVKALDGKRIPLDGAPRPAWLADINWTQTQVMNDIGQIGGWHGVVQFAGKVVS